MLFFIFQAIGTFTYIIVMFLLDLYYTTNYDGNNTSAYVVIGNPIVLSSSEYTIYADGKIGNASSGDVKAYSGNSIPYGWLICDGTQYNIADYPDLYNAIGTIYNLSTDNDDTKFRIPDYREVVLRGVGESARTEDAHNVMTLGQFQDDALQKMTGTMQFWGTETSVGAFGTCTGVFSKSGGSGNAAHNVQSHQGNTLNFDSSLIARSSTTTHDKSVAVNYIIKY